MESFFKNLFNTPNKFFAENAKQIPENLLDSDVREAFDKILSNRPTMPYKTALGLAIQDVQQKYLEATEQENRKSLLVNPSPQAIQLINSLDANMPDEQIIQILKQIKQDNQKILPELAEQKLSELFGLEKSTYLRLRYIQWQYDSEEF